MRGVICLILCWLSSTLHPLSYFTIPLSLSLSLSFSLSLSLSIFEPPPSILPPSPFCCLPLPPSR